jgi:hypothetical protein
MRSASDRGCKFQSRAPALQSYRAWTGMTVANGCVTRAALQSRLKTTDANQPVAIAIIAVVRP